MPLMEQDPEVEFVVEDGVLFDVNRCSVLGDFFNINCGRSCLRSVGQVTIAA